MDYVVTILFWLFGVLDFIGCLGGLLFLVLLFWFAFSRRGQAVQDNLHLREERRCSDCSKGNYCDAAYTGVSFPCPHFLFWGAKVEEDKSV